MTSFNSFLAFSVLLLAISVGGGRVQTKAAVTLASVIILLFFFLLLCTEDKTKMQGLCLIYDILLVSQDSSCRIQGIMSHEYDYQAYNSGTIC